MNLGIALWGSGSLWLASIALGTDMATLVVLWSIPSCTSIPLSTISVSREAHASRATIIIERDCCQSGMSSLGISGYP